MLRIKNSYLKAQKIAKYIKINQFEQSINNSNRERASNI